MKYVCKETIPFQWISDLLSLCTRSWAIRDLARYEIQVMYNYRGSKGATQANFPGAFGMIAEGKRQKKGGGYNGYATMLPNEKTMPCGQRLGMLDWLYCT
jgi:hypothetical protein